MNPICLYLSKIIKNRHGGNWDITICTAAFLKIGLKLYRQIGSKLKGKQLIFFLFFGGFSPWFVFEDWEEIRIVILVGIVFAN